MPMPLGRKDRASIPSESRALLRKEQKNTNYILTQGS